MNPLPPPHEKPTQPVRRFPAQLALMLLMLLSIVAVFVAQDWRALLGMLSIYGIIIVLAARVNWRR